jgi:cellulose synthase/poly-beta-1,6-N-acetylglucosamine synthase-like glycosyltransferase
LRQASLKKEEAVLIKDNLPGISIVKPLMGVDALLEENLESHFSLRYPKVSFSCLCILGDFKLSES